MEKNKRPDDNDPRISLNQVTGKWIFEDDEAGLEYEYDEAVKDWIPVVDEEAIKLQQEAYGGDPIANPGKKRKDRSEEDKQTGKKHKTKSERPSTSIYISGLPDDVTVDELEQVFSRYGVIAEDLISGEKKIKIYKDDDSGKPKGDALIIYFKPESVNLAVEMMDEAPLRYTSKGSAQLIRVQKAEFSKEKKEEKDKEKKETAILEKLKIQRQLQKLNEKIAVWDDDDLDKVIPKRWERVVLLKHVFTLDELEKDATTALDIKEDLMEGCEEIGPVSSITLYDLEPEGIVLVKFKNKKSADECIDIMDGRYFGGQKLEASGYDGSVKYHRTMKADEGDEEQEERLEKFGDWLDADKPDEKAE